MVSGGCRQAASGDIIQTHDGNIPGYFQPAALQLPDGAQGDAVGDAKNCLRGNGKAEHFFHPNPPEVLIEGTDPDDPRVVGGNPRFGERAVVTGIQRQNVLENPVCG